MAVMVCFPIAMAIAATVVALFLNRRFEQAALKRAVAEGKAIIDDAGNVGWVVV